jgi:hypothetical protein
MDYSFNSGIMPVNQMTALGAFSFVLFIVRYIYFSLVWMNIAKKLDYKNSWLAWIPGANIAMVLQLGGFHWALIFLLLIPVLGWLAVFVLYIIAKWRIYTKRGYPGALSLLSLLYLVQSYIPFLDYAAWISNAVVLGMVAWMDKSPLKSASAPKVTPEKKPTMLSK